MLSPLKLTPNMPTEVMIDTINQNFRQLEGESRRKVITDENGNDRIIIGRQENGTYAIKVSLDGEDANSTDPADLVMSSDWKMWKIVNSGMVYLDPTLIRRSGNLSMDSTTIGYVSDIYIWIPDVEKILNDYSTSFSSQLQVFVRDNTTKKDINYAGIYVFDGTNWGTVNHEYYLIGDGYLVIRTSVRWMAGNLGITPQSHALPAVQPYWEIANPTRAVTGGSGAGGTPTGKYIYHDAVVYNPTDEAVQYLDQSLNEYTLNPQSFTPVFTETYQFSDNTTSYFYPSGSNLPSHPPYTII